MWPSEEEDGDNFLNLLPSPRATFRLQSETLGFPTVKSSASVKLRPWKQEIEKFCYRRPHSMIFPPRGIQIHNESSDCN